MNRSRPTTKCRCLALTTAVLGLLSSHAAAQSAAQSGQDDYPLLTLGTIAETLTDSYLPAPSGPSGAVRQGWIGVADGFFTKEAHLAYDYVDAAEGDAHRVVGRLHYPFSRRLWAGLEVPVLDAEGSNGFGDPVLTTQLMLVETPGLSLNTGVGWRLPVGEEDVGGGTFAAQPQLNLWRDVGGGASLRGRVAWDFVEGGRSDGFVLNLGLGQTVTNAARTPLGELTYSVSGTWRAPTDGEATVSVIPALRTRLVSDLFLLGGVEIPLTETDGRRDERFVIQLVNGF